MQRSAVAMLAQQGGGGGGFKVNYSPDWSLFTEGGDLAQLGLNLLAAIGLVCCTGFFVWGAILAAGGVSSDVPHNVARGKRQMFVSAICALGIGVGADVAAAAPAGAQVLPTPLVSRRHATDASDGRS